MKKKIILFVALLVGQTCFAITASQIYVFADGSYVVAFCKEKPPQLFEFKKNGNNKIIVSEVIINKAPYDEGWIFMDTNTVESKDSKPPETCWVVDTSKQDFPILAKGVTAGEVYSYFESLTLKVKPGTKTEIKTLHNSSQNESYHLDFPQFDPVNADGTITNMRPKNLTMKKKNWSCTLTSVPYLDDKDGIKILLAADFNKDSLPDFIVDTASKGTDYRLNLSNKKTHNCESKATNQPLGGC